MCVCVCVYSHTYMYLCIYRYKSFIRHDILKHILQLHDFSSLISVLFQILLYAKQLFNIQKI